MDSEYDENIIIKTTKQGLLINRDEFMKVQGVYGYNTEYKMLFMDKLEFSSLIDCFT